MPSLVTNIIGGIQGASAAENAARAQQAGYKQAADSVNSAVATANPILSGAAATAGEGASNAAANAGAGMSGAVGDARTGISQATRDANAVLDPYMTSGTAATNKLNNLTQAGFSFNPTDLENDPGYQFRLAQGMKAIGNSTAARGLGGSGLALKGAADYSQQLAGTEYQNAYQRALGTYQANVNSLLPVAGMGLTAGTTAGANLTNAARYSGDVGMQGAQYIGNTGLQAAEYAGDKGYAGARDVAGNLVNAGVYQGNTQIGSGNAIAQGDIGAANSWNQMLGGIGTAANSVFGMGFGSGGGWSFGNIGQNFGNLWNAGNYRMSGGGGMVQPGQPGYNPNADANWGG